MPVTIPRVLPRVLALHGARQTAAIFRDRLRPFQRSAELVCPEGLVAFADGTGCSCNAGYEPAGYYDQASSSAAVSVWPSLLANMRAVLP